MIYIKVRSDRARNCQLVLFECNSPNTRLSSRVPVSVSSDIEI